MNITLEAEEFWEAFCDHNADLNKDELYYDVTGDRTIVTDMEAGLKGGGNDAYAFKSLSKWAGIIEETEEKNTYQNGEAYNIDYSKINYVLAGQYYFPMSDMDTVKQFVMNNGAVSTSYCDDADYAHPDDEKDFSYYYLYRLKKLEKLAKNLKKFSKTLAKRKNVCYNTRVAL